MSSSPAPESALKPTLGVFDVVAITEIGRAHV